MCSHRVIQNVRVILLICLLLISATHVSAQSNPPNTLSLSEAQINTALRANNKNEANDLSIDLQPGQFVVNLESTGPRGNTTRLGLTIVPSIAAGELRLEATHLTINDLAININNNPAARATTGALDDFLTEQTAGGQLQSIAITDSNLRIDWLNPDPNAPIVTIQDNFFSLTFTESSINNMQWVTNPTGDYISGVNVDLLPGQAIIDVSRTINPTDVRYTFIPTVINGVVSWQVSTGANYENGLTNAVSTVWRAFFDGIYRENNLTNATITDDRITFTWDLGNAKSSPTGDSVVTYTINENEVNAALASFTTPELNQLSVEIQPNSVIINATGTNQAGAAYTASLSLVPVLANGDLTWEPESLTLNNLVVDANVFQGDNLVTEQLTRGIGNTRNNATITNFTMDDTTMTMTVRYR